mgnify:CR=1 FL=1
MGFGDAKKAKMKIQRAFISILVLIGLSRDERKARVTDMARVEYESGTSRSANNFHGKYGEFALRTWKNKV